MNATMITPTKIQNVERHFWLALCTGGSRWEGGGNPAMPGSRPSSHMQRPIRPHTSLKQHVKMLKNTKYLSRKYAPD